jgi:hypothetical protein
MNQIREDDRPGLNPLHPPPATESSTGGNQPSQNTSEPQTQKIAQNPNPRANENVRGNPLGDNADASQGTGSEISDGEDG